MSIQFSYIMQFRCCRWLSRVSYCGLSEICDLNQVICYMCYMWLILVTWWIRAPPWSGSSVLDHRSLPPVFESQRGYIWRLFHLWLRLITLRGLLDWFSLPCTQKWPSNIIIIIITWWIKMPSSIINHSIVLFIWCVMFIECHWWWSVWDV